MFINFYFLTPKMGRPKKDLKERILEFSQDGLYIADSNILMCQFCNVCLDSDKKDTFKNISNLKHI
jgi:hypothetical protein